MTDTNALSLLYAQGGLPRYLAEINRFPMLKAEEEYMLAKRYHETGDVQAAHQLTTSHLRLAAKVAISFRHYGLALADLISEANIGLMQAIKKFDPDKGFRLATYAIWWIKAAVSEFILKSWSLVKIGTVATQKRLFYNLHKIKSRLGLYGDAGLSDETAEYISKTLNVSKRDVMEMEQRLSGDSSLNAPLASDSGTSFQEMLSDSDETIEQKIGDTQELDLKKKLLAEALGELSEREQRILSCRYLNERATTLEDLGSELNISRERVRQIENKALEKIRKSIQAKAQKIALA